MGRVATLIERKLIVAVRDGRLEIDADGQAWRPPTKSGQPRRRAEHRTPQGYLQVRMVIDGKRLHVMAHRLVWQHFKGDIPPGEEINHDNGLKDDNRPDNLLCGSGADNVEHAQRNGLLDQHGERNPAAKLTDNQVAQIRLAYSKGGYTMEELGKRFGVRFQHISRLVRGQRRPKQGGPVASSDLRPSACDRDPTTKRFVGKRRAGRLLDGREHNAMPEVPR